MTEAKTRDQIILEWNEAQKALAVAKEREAMLRKEALQVAFKFEGDDREGTQNIELGAGWKLKAVFKLNRRLNNNNEAVDKVLTKIEKSSPEGAIIAERLVKYEPKLNKKEYDILPDKFKKLFDEVLTAKPGTPSLTLIPPKSE